MEIQGKVIQLMPEQTGEGRNGTWKKKDYVIETGDKYPKKLCFNMWGDKIDQFPMKEGDDVKVHFDVESREYNGRWYTEVKAWKVDNLSQQAGGGAPAAGGNVDLSAPEFNAPPPGEDDLPF